MLLEVIFVKTVIRVSWRNNIILSSYDFDTCISS